MRLLFICFVIIVSEMCITTLYAQSQLNKRQRQNFCSDWKFYLGDVKEGQSPDLNDASWRKLNLPHDWSIEGSFSKNNPATPGGGALPGGIGWYRKSFSLPQDENGKRFYIEFDGVYRNSEVWINGHYLGIRPYGFSSFRYELTPFLNFGSKKNLLAVKVDNSKQPNSRWYSGSGIYRNVWLVVTNPVFVDHWGTYVTTPEITVNSAKVHVVTKVRKKKSSDQKITLKTF